MKGVRFVLSVLLALALTIGVFMACDTGDGGGGGGYSDGYYSDGSW